MKDFLAVAFGGGRNGAMLLGMYEHGIKPDIITFANTGRADRTEGEKRKTYENLDRMSRWCEEHFGIPITEVHKRSMYASLYDQSMRNATWAANLYLVNLYWQSPSSSLEMAADFHCKLQNLLPVRVHHA